MLRARTSKGHVYARIYCRKPSLAAAIFKGLGGDVNKEKKDGYYQRGSDVVTWSLGHLLALYDPEDYNAEHKKWTLDSLPLNTVYPPKMKPIAKSKKQLNVVLDWIKKSRLDCACR
ncbi:DNA topoisomerase III [Vibrio astriarenae]|nr:DNA topoisomerase III [Vibrio sp. C7]